jgi:CubicO group peptidase (beta-lactamase class C family)
MQAYHGRVPGAVVGIYREGRPVWCHAYGLADLEIQVPATTSTQFRLASISKQFTAAAVLLLAEEERLSLDDDASYWLSSLRQAAPNVTLRQLLTHTSGVIDFEELIAPGRRVQLRDAEVPALLEGRPGGYFAPGSSYRYSNTGYVLLALIVECASGMDFATFLRTRIFSPLGMLSSVAFEEGVSSVDYRAFGYRALQNTWLRNDQDLTSATLGDGALGRRLERRPVAQASIVARRVLPLDENRGSGRALRIWLAHHRRLRMALRRNCRISQCHRALQRRPIDGGCLDQPR